jgi:hypothetical protein
MARHRFWNRDGTRALRHCARSNYVVVVSGGETCAVDRADCTLLTSLLGLRRCFLRTLASPRDKAVPLGGPDVREPGRSFRPRKAEHIAPSQDAGSMTFGSRSAAQRLDGRAPSHWRDGQISAGLLPFAFWADPKVNKRSLMAS